MMVGVSVIRLVQLAVLVAVPLDAFALSPARVNGAGQGNVGLNGHGKPGALRAARALSPSFRPEVSNTVLTMSGGGDDGQVGTS